MEAEPSFQFVPRKVVVLTSTHGWVYALTEDGSMWRQYVGTSSWAEVSPVPDRKRRGPRATTGGPPFTY